MADDGWSPDEIAKMSGRSRGALSEQDGRCFMALIDMCHFLVDQITQEHRFAGVMEASKLRETRVDLAQKLSAQMYSYWEHAPAGPGVYEMLLQWTADQPGSGMASRHAREHGRRQGPASSMPLYVLAKNECGQWPRRRKHGVYYLAGEDDDGAALLVDESMSHVYRVIGISTSIPNMLRANGCVGDELWGAALLLTLLPFLGRIVYDATLRGAPPRGGSSHRAELKSLVAKAQAEGTILRELPEVEEAPLVGKRVLISGLAAKPELNGTHARAESFIDSKGRYGCRLADGSMIALKPTNLEEAADQTADEQPPGGSDGGGDEAAKAVATLTRLPPMKGDAGFWTFRRMGYTEAENPQHAAVLITGAGGMLPVSASSPALITRRLAPTTHEYLQAVASAAACARGKPERVAIDEKSAVEPLLKLLEPCGIFVGYYPPPSSEELTSMGLDGSHANGRAW